MLDRTTDATGAVARLPWSVVGQAKIGGREPVSRLEDLLEELPDALMNIDVKAESAIQPLIDTLRRTNAFDRVCVASFSEARLAAGAAHRGRGAADVDGHRGRSRGCGRRAGCRSSCRAAGGARQRIAQVPVRHGRLTVVDKRLIAAARRRGIEVHVWTIDEPARCTS